MPCYEVRQISQSETYQSLETLIGGMRRIGLTVETLGEGHIQFEGFIKGPADAETHRVAGRYRVVKGNGTMTLIAGTDVDFNLIRVGYAKQGIAQAAAKYGFKSTQTAPNAYILNKS